MNNLTRVTLYLNFGLASHALCFILFLLLLLLLLLLLSLLITLLLLLPLQFFILLVDLISLYKICMVQKRDFGSILLSGC